jgi:hypothetical protein
VEAGEEDMLLEPVPHVGDSRRHGEVPGWLSDLREDALSSGPAEVLDHDRPKDILTENAGGMNGGNELDAMAVDRPSRSREDGAPPLEDAGEAGESPESCIPEGDDEGGLEAVNVSLELS